MYTYNIKYNLDGGTLDNNAIKKYSVETNTFNLPTPIKNGYTFEGWYLDSEFTSEKQIKIEKGTIGEKEYYAKWSIDTYTIYYELNNGSIIGENPIRLKIKKQIMMNVFLNF